MNNRVFKTEELLYAAALLVALIVRLVALGQVALNDGEAALALQSLALARSETTLLSSQPGYILPTALLFALFEGSNFLARIWPVLVGSLLAITPYFFRKELGRAAGLVLAFSLALEPGLVAVSRQAGSAIMAVTFLILALGLWRNGSALTAGIVAGLALLSGPQIWPGLLILVVVALLWPQTTGGLALRDPQIRRLAGGAALVTLLIVGTAFFTIPTGLSAALTSLPDYVISWVQPGGIGVLLPLVALVVYSLPGLIFGVWGALMGLVNSDPVDRALGAGVVVALLLVLAKPGRQIIDLIWVLPLLWALASRKAVRLLRPGEEEKLPVLAQAVLSFVLVVFAWMNFAAVYMPSLNNSESLVRLAAVAGALMLLALSSLLMGVGWSWPAMRTGLAWGLGLALVIFTLSAGYRASGLDEKPHMELWQGRNPPQNAALIEDTIGDAAMWQNGHRSVTDVTVIGFTSPALDWALRGVRDVTHEPFLPVEANPSVVITPLQDELALINSYRGQDFTWTAEVDWPSMTLENGFAWLLARQAPELPTNIIVWVRADLFAGSAGQPADQPAPLAPAE